MHCDLDLWPFDLKIYRAHPCLMGSLHVKFHDDRCKGKAVMRRKPFSVIYALWPWPLDLKIYRAHPCLMGSLHVKFYDDRCKGKTVMRRKPKCGRQTDGWTDGQTDMVIPVYPPPNFVAGGINICKTMQVLYQGKAAKCRWMYITSTILSVVGHFAYNLKRCIHVYIASTMCQLSFISAL